MDYLYFAFVTLAFIAAVLFLDEWRKLYGRRAGAKG